MASTTIANDINCPHMVIKKLTREGKAKEDEIGERGNQKIYFKVLIVILLPTVAPLFISIN
ncbi:MULTISPECIES: hypothetical protein [Bacillus cereus group]|uniref:hypothetical protein n=1 Tax=Bacillus cereus group TaxID=86661 RepID=UPI0020D21B8D|nr:MULTISPECIES: hypothetical protein [Bacillus cereus group]